MILSQSGPSTLSVMVSVWIEGVFYGMNMVVYFTCLCVITSRKARQVRKLNKGLLALSTLLFASATAHMVINIRRLIEGYILSPTKAAMDDYFHDIRQPLSVAHEFFVVITYFFSDLIITWRVRIVWGYSWHITLIPLVLCLSAFTSGIGVGISTAVVQPGESIFSKTIARFGDAWITLSLLTNVTATSLIASRIWWVTRGISTLQTDSFPSKPSFFRPRKCTEGPFNTWKRHNLQYWRLLVAIIESAACAAVVQVIQLAFYASKFAGAPFVNNLSVQVMAISPLLIIAFVGLTSNRLGEDWSTCVSHSSYSTAYGGRHRAQASSSGNAVSGRGVGTVRGGGERLTGGETDGLPPMEFNVTAVSFAESESEIGMHFTGKDDEADEEISPLPQRRQVESVMPTKNEEIEMQPIAG